MPVAKEFISKTTFTVIPACLESFPLVWNLKKDAGPIPDPPEAGGNKSQHDRIVIGM